jgi:hypothetical protein
VCVLFSVSPHSHNSKLLSPGNYASGPHSALRPNDVDDDVDVVISCADADSDVDHFY